jgi:thymidylate synthase (FAD)
LKQTIVASVTKIEPAGVRDVYDLEVMSPHHNFVANGFVVHNCEFKFHCAMPIFVARQWIRHRTASVNEYSARYSLVPDLFYTPPGDSIRSQSTTNKQGGEKGMGGELADMHSMAFAMEAADHFSNYRERTDAGMARELARINLPLSTYTQWYWKIDLHNLLRFLGLRCDAHAQEEIRAFANVMAGIVREVCPLAFEAWYDFCYAAHTFSRTELLLLQGLLRREASGTVLGLSANNGTIVETAMEDAGLSKRERDDFLAVFRSANDQPLVYADEAFPLDRSKAKPPEYFEKDWTIKTE